MCHLFIILEVLHAQEKMAKMALQKYVVGDHFKQICWERGASICFWKNWEVLGLLEWLSLGPQKFRPVMPLPPWPQQFTFWGEQTLQPDAVSLSILLATEELPETSRRCSPFSSDSTTQGLCLSSSKKHRVCSNLRVANGTKSRIVVVITKLLTVFSTCRQPFNNPLHCWEGLGSRTWQRKWKWQSHVSCSCWCG